MNRKVTVQQEQEIIELYKQGLSIKEIANRYGLKWAQSVTEIAKRNGVTLRNQGAPRVFTYDVGFFAKMDEQCCYWAGFIAADGCILDSLSTMYLQIALKKIDIRHLEKFNEAIKSTYSIKEDNNSARLVMGLDARTVADLANLGITPRKSLTFAPPKHLTGEQKKWFLRGYFDGDGILSFRRNKRGEVAPYKTAVGILGTEEMIGYYVEAVKELTGVVLTAKPIKRGNIFEVRNYISRDNLTVLNWLYGKASPLCVLDRKFERYRASKEALAK